MTAYSIMVTLLAVYLGWVSWQFAHKLDERVYTLEKIEYHRIQGRLDFKKDLNLDQYDPWASPLGGEDMIDDVARVQKEAMLLAAQAEAKCRAMERESLNSGKS